MLSGDMMMMMMMIMGYWSTIVEMGGWVDECGIYVVDCESYFCGWEVEVDVEVGVPTSKS